MKIIDILNKIANGEEPPKKIEYCGDTYRYANYDYISQDDVYLFQDRDFFNILNLI